MSLRNSCPFRVRQLIARAAAILATGIHVWLAIAASASAQTQTQAQAQTQDGAEITNNINTLEAMRATADVVRAAAASVEPSLVTIESWGGVGARSGKIGGIRKQGEGNTTGIVISQDGYIITSTFNFIERPPIIMVVTSDNKRHTAKLQGRDDLRKICLLKITDLKTDEALVIPKIAPLEKIKVGQWSISMGVGYGDSSPAIAVGIISAKNRIGGRAIQTDANISPANYGGPLIDIDGAVMGICVPMNPQSQAIGAGVEWYDSGIGFAIPIDGAEQLIERLKDSNTKIEPAFLGVKAIANPNGDGMWIEQVVPNTAAANVSLAREDVLIRVDGKAVSDLMGLKQVLIALEAGQKTTIEYLAKGKGKLIKKDITFVPRPASKKEIDQLAPPEIR